MHWLTVIVTVTLLAVIVVVVLSLFVKNTDKRSFNIKAKVSKVFEFEYKFSNFDIKNDNDLGWHRDHK